MASFRSAFHRLVAVSCKDQNFPGKVETFWCMHERSVRVTSLRWREGFIESLKRVVWHFLQKGADFQSDLALGRRLHRCSREDTSQLVSVINETFWRSVATWISAGTIAGIRPTSQNRYFEGGMCSLSSTKKMRCHCWICTEIEFLLRSCRKLWIAFEAKVLPVPSEETGRNNWEEDKEEWWRREGNVMEPKGRTEIGVRCRGTCDW